MVEKTKTIKRVFLYNMRGMEITHDIGNRVGDAKEIIADGASVRIIFLDDTETMYYNHAYQTFTEIPSKKKRGK